MEQELPQPGAGQKVERMQGHWLLARLGKRVLRPGGIELTRQMLSALDIGQDDRVVEFAPGLGITAKLTLARKPQAYTGIEADEIAAQRVRLYLDGAQQQCLVRHAEATGLPDGAASVVYGEAMLTMQSTTQKSQIVREAYRLLQPGGRYAIHEICLTPDDIAEQDKAEIRKALAEAIRVGARPFTISEWRELLAQEGFSVKTQLTAPMHLLEPARVLRDEGLRNTLRIAKNILRDAEARRRVLSMRRVFRQYRHQLGAVTLIAVKE